MWEDREKNCPKEWWKSIKKEETVQEMRALAAKERK